MPDHLKAGIIGLGILGRQYADYLHRHPAIALAAVADVRSATAAEFAAQYGVTPYTDYRAMFQDEALDLVVVATPDHLHCAPTLAAIEAGIPNIIQEKPLATSQEDADAIYEAVEQRGTRFFVNFANRAAPLDRATRYVIQHGLIGTPAYGELRLDDNISVPTSLWGDRSRAFAGASSPAHFLLSHVVDLARWYFAPAEIVDVYAIAQQRVLGYSVDLYDAFLTFDSGLRLRAKAEWIKHIDELVEFSMTFSGSEGTIIYNKLPGFGTQAGWRANLASSLHSDELLQHRQALVDLGVPARGLILPPRPESSKSTDDSAPRLALEYPGALDSSGMALVGPFIDAILEETAEPKCWVGNGPLPNHVDGLRQTQVVLALIESSTRGQPVALAPQR